MEFREEEYKGKWPESYGKVGKVGDAYIYLWQTSFLDCAHTLAFNNKGQYEEEKEWVKSFMRLSSYIDFDTVKVRRSLVLQDSYGHAAMRNFKDKFPRHDNHTYRLSVLEEALKDSSRDASKITFYGVATRVNENGVYSFRSQDGKVISDAIINRSVYGTSPDFAGFIYYITFLLKDDPNQHTHKLGACNREDTFANLRFVNKYSKEELEQFDRDTKGIELFFVCGSYCEIAPGFPDGYATNPYALPMGFDTYLNTRFLQRLMAEGYQPNIPGMVTTVGRKKTFVGKIDQRVAGNNFTVSGEHAKW